MKKIIDIISSPVLTFVLLFVLTIAMGAATFIEERWDIATARLIIYNAPWFEAIMVFLVFNFIGNIGRYKLYKKGKLSNLLFHLSFVIMIIGAGITRYVSYEGMMHIRVGQTTNMMHGSQTYLQVVANDNINKYSYDLPLVMSTLKDNAFDFSIQTKGAGEINVRYLDFVPNAVTKVEENMEGGKDMIGIILYEANDGEELFLLDGEIINLGGFIFAFNNTEGHDVLRASEKDGKLSFTSPFEVISLNNSGSVIDTIQGDSLGYFEEGQAYSANGTVFMITKLYKDAKEVVISGAPGEQSPDAILMAINVGGQKHEITVYGGSGYSGNFQTFELGNLSFKAAFGERSIELPFSLTLDNFILEKYAGTMDRASSFESQVTLTDNRNGLNEKRRIFMNNVLDYDGYRFFQSGMDADERGTFLSVSHDVLGTMITYISYTLLTIGFLITLVSRKSRFLFLMKENREIRKKRKALITTLVLLLGFGLTSYAQTGDKHVSPEHADAFGRILTQTLDGRFQPVHTLAYDVVHKIARKDKFEFDEYGEMDGMEVFLDMIANPEFWKEQEIIYVAEKPLRDTVGATSKFLKFSDFFDEFGKYKLEKFYNSALLKNRIDQNPLDREVFKIDERLKIMMAVFNGSILTIFPEQGGENNNWISCNETPSFMPLSGVVKVINDDLKLPSFTYNNLMNTYRAELERAVSSGDYSQVDKIVGYFISIQRQGTAENILPTESMVDTEVSYNKLKIFESLRIWYATLSLVLLVLAFIENLRAKRSRLVRVLLSFFMVMVGIGFVYHTYGMIVRWYLTGHAPWSNGYEALILVAWGAVLAGFLFARSSKIALASTVLIAFLTLMTAGHSSYDPQLTNLMPVLKSYWLIIHVATLTISYCFFGSGCILGLINILLIFFKNKKNAIRIDLTIRELTNINEMNLTIGIILATIGTFLGGVWANESWGRYWGWDAKETWALVIVIFYALVLHLRFIPWLKSKYAFNVFSIVAFGTVLMTFIGVNYYLSKGMHSYARGETPIFPIWGWITIFSLIVIIVAAGIKANKNKKSIEES